MSDFANRMAWIVTTLCAALGAYGRRIATPPQPVWLGTRCYMPATEPEQLPRLPIPLWNLFIRRVQRVAARVHVLHEQWRAGTLKPTRPRTARAKPQTPRTPGPRLPRAFAWANRRARELASAAGMLNMLLQETEGRSFLAEVPRAARLVRPLCQALGVEQPQWLRLPVPHARPAGISPTPPCACSPTSSAPPGRGAKNPSPNPPGTPHPIYYDIILFRHTRPPATTSPAPGNTPQSP